MSNRSYLAASDADTIYPSFAQKDYDAARQLIATDVQSLPLLWLALFREDDLRQEVFKVEGEEIPAFAPACTKERGLAQLEQAIPYPSKIFPELGPLEEFGAMFRAAIEPLPYRFVSIELEEIAAPYPKEHRFEELLTLGLRGFDAPEQIRFKCDAVTIDCSRAQILFEPMAGCETDAAFTELLEKLNTGGPVSGGEIVRIEGFTADSHAEVLERLSCLRKGVRLPSVRMYLDDLKYSGDEQWNLTRVLGAGVHGSMGLRPRSSVGKRGRRFWMGVQAGRRRRVSDLIVRRL